MVGKEDISLECAGLAAVWPTVGIEFRRVPDYRVAKAVPGHRTPKS